MAMQDPPFQKGTANMHSSKIEIHVSCRNVKDMSKTGLMCVFSVSDIKTHQWKEAGRTEIIRNTLDPDFQKKFVIDFYFEERQLLMFTLYDVDSSNQQLQEQALLGRYKCSVGQLVSSPESMMEKPLEGRAQGNIIVRFKEVNASKDEVTLQFKASNLDKKDFFGKSDPFLRLHRVNDDQSCTAVQKTEVIKNNLNPTWRPVTISVQTLCNGDYNRSIQIECYDWDSDGSHDFIGAFSTTLNELSRGAVEANIFPVINPKKQAKKKNYKDSGQIQVLRCTIQQHQSFLDYIKGGLQMQFMVAIDFTASNGNPTHPSSLHYIHPQQPNQYVAAIKAIGEIIQDYNSKKMFPVLGFGAKLPDGQVSHDFAVNFNPQNPCVQGVDGILQAYQAALSRIQLHSPTNFSPVINLLSRYASEARDGSTYFTLLIITDGEITDMQQTKNAIVMASSLPMSIIIVGVGNAEFDAMEILDSDNCLLTDSNGRGAERDIVQFVPFRDFLGGRFGNNIESSKAALAKEVLAKIPDQVLEYMRKYDIRAKVPATAAP
ncbi:copine-8-like [Pomacea canaliculata]|uniref:copine-8-like n=1 Tax=Pomacea canaliculata TaxID=400727 RepID=UPI000D731889|nr:copine-8-like [Pomacea canaliculata]XP_025107724.1 copine-8-like [Pomacea canaliculata]XP_025107725.1 copine-8-like [Pomacea canaliculata]XP_025107726.1 copine-8-like [Pomacea canaliculata]XP_025107727.1 copine-8-like [Pomacea canaliculata]XP_025107729.1 copine-8-like [Pomacea canaliculata]